MYITIIVWLYVVGAWQTYMSMIAACPGITRSRLILPIVIWPIWIAVAMVYVEGKHYFKRSE